MKRTQYLRWLGALYALPVLGIGGVLALHYPEINTAGLLFLLVCLLLFGFAAFRCFRGLNAALAEDAAYVPPGDEEALEQITYFKRLLLLAVPAFPILALWIYSDLKQLESGAAESVRIWGPVAFLYEQGGFWVAILAVPLLGVFVLGALLKKMNNPD
ncbi:MAG: hypothetical protein IT260_05205 [Saprospiraceae bacterium]|nr:hypothetical protein [Saprospiraceae bacterium]